MATSMQFEPVPDTPEQPAVTVSVADTPRLPLAVMVKVLPICPAPETLDWVGCAETAVMNCPVVQPAQLKAWPTTNGLAWALNPPVKVTVDPEIVSGMRPRQTCW